MIPKTIHFVWFGGNDLGEKEQRCIESWKKQLPDYEIIRWDESNFDISCNKYCQEAYSAKKWAFVSDYVRLWALVNYGGIYMDTDVEVVRPLDDLLNNVAFSGFEREDSIPTGIMACEKGFNLFAELLKPYENRSFILEDGSFDLTTNVVSITNYCKNKGLALNNRFQVIDGFALYPTDYFCPKDYITGKISISANTYTIHHFTSSWMDEKVKEFIDIRQNILKKHPMVNITFASIGARVQLSLKERSIKALSPFYFKNKNK